MHPDARSSGKRPSDHLAELLAAQPYEVSQAMTRLGSHFYRALAAAFDRADARNRRLILTTWTEDIWTLLARARAADRPAGVDSAP